MTSTNTVLIRIWAARVNRIEPRAGELAWQRALVPKLRIADRRFQQRKYKLYDIVYSVTNGVWPVKVTPHMLRLYDDAVHEARARYWRARLKQWGRQGALALAALIPFLVYFIWKWRERS